MVTDDNSEFRSNSDGDCPEQLKLRRSFGLLPGVTIVCGLVIGTGIWVSPGVIMERTNSTGASYDSAQFYIPVFYPSPNSIYFNKLNMLKTITIDIKRPFSVT